MGEWVGVGVRVREGGGGNLIPRDEINPEEKRKKKDLRERLTTSTGE